MSDEEVFQTARNYVVGLLQKITMDDFLPILIGKKAFSDLIGQYDGYKTNVNPNIANEFSTAAFRIGHPLMINKFSLINRYDEVEEEKMLHELFFSPDFVSEETI